MEEAASGGSGSIAPLKPIGTILDQEVEQAQEELSRPSAGLFLSGLIAGFGVSVSMLLAAAVHSAAPAEPGLGTALIAAAAYSVGFILVIMAHTDLFTEYTTMAILPVLLGRARLSALGRLWALVFSSNLIGAAAFTLIAVLLAPRLDLVATGTFEDVARRLVEFPVWAVVLSGAVTGWLMGLLSWLISAARDTTSQVLFIFLISGSIGFTGLHHSISGTAEVLAGVLTSPALGLGTLARFLVWTTLGNTVGGVVFAILIRYSVLIGGEERGPRKGEASEGR